MSERKPKGILPGTNLCEYEYPIRPGVMAYLTLPLDMTEMEVRRLEAWAMTLPLPEPPQD